MSGWSSHLTSEARMTSLLHLGVFSFNGDCWAHTAGLQVTQSDLQRLESLQSDDTPMTSPVVTHMS